jgi:hypothetical protein
MPCLQNPSSSSEQTVAQTKPSDKCPPCVAAPALKVLDTIIQTIPKENLNSWSGFAGENNRQRIDGLSGSPTDVFCQEFTFQDVFEYSGWCEQTTSAEGAERIKPSRSQHPLLSLPNYVRGSREVRTRSAVARSGRKAPRSFQRRNKVLRQ